MKKDKKQINEEIKQDIKKVNKRIGGIIIKNIAIFIGLAITVLSWIFYDELLGEDASINIFSKLADKFSLQSLQTAIKFIPKIIEIIRVLSLFALLLIIVGLILKLCFHRTRRQITIVKMINSLFKYAVAIVDVLFILNIFGVDTAALIASASVLTLVVGLGANSLISDIISGISIIFDEQFEVGDMVVIDGFRGNVDEIGIRTTKIVDWTGHVKIINNSKITSVLNESKNETYAVCNIDIDYGEDLVRVEKIIRDNLEAIASRIPNVKGKINYNGVSSLKESSMSLLFTVKCETPNLYPIQRAMNREFKLLFDENNIKIPFPQITISDRSNINNDEHNDTNQ